MKCIPLFLVAFLMMSFSGFGQEEESTKKFDHYASLQVNELIKQILNLSNSASIFSPYLLNYAFNSTSSGYGMNVGFGYTLSETKSGDDLNSQETNSSLTSIRIGPERKINLGNKWNLGVGVDFLYSEDKFETIFVSRDFFGNESISESVDNKTSTGAGLRGSIYFSISPRVLIGTEATYKFEKNVTKSSTKTTSNGKTQETEQTPTTKNVDFTPPVHLWLTLKF